MLWRPTSIAATRGCRRGEQRRQARVGAAVVGDLEHVDRRQVERRGDVGLSASAVSSSENAAGLERARPRALSFGLPLGAPAGARGGGHSTLEAQAAERDHLARRAGVSCRPGGRGAAAARAGPRDAPAGAAVDHQPRAVARR